MSFPCHSDASVFVTDLLTVKASVLFLHQVRIKAALLHQLVVTAFLHDRPTVEDNYVVGLLHNAHGVGYQQHGAVVSLVQQSLVDLRSTIMI